MKSCCPRLLVGLLLAAPLLSAPPSVRAQSLAVDDPVLRAMWAEGMESSEAWDIGQALLERTPLLAGDDVLEHPALGMGLAIVATLLSEPLEWPLMLAGMLVETSAGSISAAPISNRNTNQRSSR